MCLCPPHVLRGPTEPQLQNMSYMILGPLKDLLKDYWVPLGSEGVAAAVLSAVVAGIILRNPHMHVLKVFRTTGASETQTLASKLVALRF